ncbi:MAG: SRPBCC domain-containing protein [Leptolinea sp.]|jgi:uncharacterized protein YndB with AHSA1/START domain|nr:SRPBCC domain-containing protein [Leptolinea sp.]
MDYLAKTSIFINAPVKRVWLALVTPADIKHYMFGTNAVSNWHVGSPISWKGEWQGKPYEDRGVILRVLPEQMLRYSHYSPLSGLPNEPEYYHTVTIELAPEGGGTRVELTQDNNENEEERAHSEQNWGIVLLGMKRYLEK